MRLDDFYHLPILADTLATLQAEQAGLVLVAGLDLPASAALGSEGLLPSGRATIFRLLADALLAAHRAPAAVIAADAAAFRVARSQRQQVHLLQVRRQHTYATRLAEALKRNAQLLVLDQLTPESVALIAPALQAGRRVLTQLNSAARGIALLHELGAFGLAEPLLTAGAWLVAVQRLALLCPACRQPRALTASQQLYLRLDQRSWLGGEQQYYLAGGCENCHQQGRSGTVALFDICRLAPAADATPVLEQILPLEGYAQQLAARGDLAFDDVIALDGAQTHKIFQQFTANQQALASANQALERRLAELHSANQVLQQRTSALLSLQTIGQALISSTDLHELARRVCQHVRELCHADRAALYLLGGEGSATILAVSGWEASLVGRQLPDAALRATISEPAGFQGWPPGVPPQHADRAGGDLRAGLSVPLIAEGRQVGTLIIHSMRRARFAPGEVALLQTLAHQAALLIQRTGLIDRLNDNITQLQAAQAALVQQQRLAREMELAAQVQQSILPHVFPQLPGVHFAADNKPARQVGGDFYDVFMLDDSTIGLVIADVSGKGIPAALYMALTRSLLLAEARRERSPQAVLLNVNRLLREVGDPQMFVTVFYGVLCTASRQLTYARAGHDYPLLFRAGAVQHLTGRGIVLGILDIDAGQLSEEQLTLQAGDRLVLYTDGLTDVVNPANQRLELPGLTALLQTEQYAAPQAICEAAFAALSEYQGSAEQFDDMTLLVVGVEDGGRMMGTEDGGRRTEDG